MEPDPIWPTTLTVYILYAILLSSRGHIVINSACDPHWSSHIHLRLLLKAILLLYINFEGFGHQDRWCGDCWSVHWGFVENLEKLSGRWVKQHAAIVQRKLTNQCRSHQSVRDTWRGKPSIITFRLGTENFQSMNRFYKINCITQTFIPKMISSLILFPLF